MSTATLPDAPASPAPFNPGLNDLIEATPGVCMGKPRIAGTRTKVSFVYEWIELGGQSVAEVLENYPHLTREQVYAALTYCYTHEDEIKRQIETEREVERVARAAAGPSVIPGKLIQLAKAGTLTPALRERARELGVELEPVEGLPDASKHPLPSG